MTRKTYLIDIDGTIFEHAYDLVEMTCGPMFLLDGVLDKLIEWRKLGHYIVLTTARPEGIRAVTERQLHNHGVFYDQLVMGLTNGPRVLINDEKPDGTITANAVCIKRNSGLRQINE